MDFTNKRLQSVTAKRSIMVLPGLQITTTCGLRIWIHGGKTTGFLLQCLKTPEYHKLSELITDPAAQTRTSITQPAGRQLHGTQPKEQGLFFCSC